MNLRSSCRIFKKKSNRHPVQVRLLRSRTFSFITFTTVAGSVVHFAVLYFGHFFIAIYITSHYHASIMDRAEDLFVDFPAFTIR